MTHPTKASQQTRLAQIGTELGDDYMTLAILCAGLARIRMDRQNAEAGLLVPGQEAQVLPAAMSTAVTRLWWRALEQGAAWPRSEYDVLMWCRRPLRTWPVRLDVSDQDAEVVLLDGDDLSEFAEHATRLASHADVESEVVQNKSFRSLMLVAQIHGTTEIEVQANYEFLRRLLIDQPVLSDRDLRELVRRFPAVSPHGQPHVTAFIQGAYMFREGSGTVTLAVCDRCGNPMEQPGAACLVPGCGGTRTTRGFTALSGIYVQHRSTRRYFHDPGLAEVRLMDRLALLAQSADCGFTMRAWPGLDAWDIAVGFPTDGNGTEWWVGDVKDQSSAGLLGRMFKPDPRHPADRRFLILPQHRYEAPFYVDSLRTQLEGRVEGIRIVSEDAFVSLVEERVGLGGYR